MGRGDGVWVCAWMRKGNSGAVVVVVVVVLVCVSVCVCGGGGGLKRSLRAFAAETRTQVLIQMAPTAYLHVLSRAAYPIHV
jgi:hypothetical protein